MKTIYLLLALAVPAVTRGQAPTARPVVASMATTGAFFALSVADLSASTRWYSEKLGLRVVMRAPRANGPAAVTVLEGGGLVVELLQHDDASPLSTAAPGAKGSLFVHGLFKAGVIVNDFDATVAMLRARGVEIAMGPFPARADQRANVIIKDNAGNLLQILGK